MTRGESIRCAGLHAEIAGESGAFDGETACGCSNPGRTSRLADVLFAPQGANRAIRSAEWCGGDRSAEWCGGDSGVEGTDPHFHHPPKWCGGDRPQFSSSATPKTSGRTTLDAENARPNRLLCFGFCDAKMTDLELPKDFHEFRSAHRLDDTGACPEDAGSISLAGFTTRWHVATARLYLRRRPTESD